MPRKRVEGRRYRLGSNPSEIPSLQILSLALSALPCQVLVIGVVGVSKQPTDFLQVP
jgi:hypothetical protein